MMKRLKQLVHEHRYLLANIVCWSIALAILLLFAGCAGLDYCFNCGAR